MGACLHLRLGLSVTTALPGCPVLPLADEHWPIPAPDKPSRERHKIQQVRTSESTWGEGKTTGAPCMPPPPTPPAALLTHPHRVAVPAPRGGPGGSLAPAHKPSKGFHKQKPVAKGRAVSWGQGHNLLFQVLGAQLPGSGGENHTSRYFSTHRTYPPHPPRQWGVCLSCALHTRTHHTSAETQTPPSEAQAGQEPAEQRFRGIGLPGT